MQTSLDNSTPKEIFSKIEQGTVSSSSGDVWSVLPGITADIAYVEPRAERPHNYMYEPPNGEPWQNCEYRLHQVHIADARAMISPPSIHVEGFELSDAPTAVSDFTDEDALRSQYFAEAAELARSTTGADQAFVFDHLIRRRESGRPALNFGRRGDGSQPGAAGRAHNDYSTASGARRFEIEALNFKIRAPVQRFAIVNIWRSIGGKIEDTPLAICDARTVSENDLVVTEMRYPNRNGEIYLVQHSPRHRWAYFSEMDRHEALIFKQYDSRVNGATRFTPHSAFDLPETPIDAPLRQSIELRCLVTFS